MGNRAKELSVHSYISFNGPDGEYKRWEDCTEEEIRYFRQKVGEKLSKVTADIIEQRIANGQPLDLV